MSDDEAVVCIVLVILVMCASLFGGWQIGKADTQDKAVKAGAGEYYIEKETLEKKFRWTPKN